MLNSSTYLKKYKKMVAFGPLTNANLYLRVIHNSYGCIWWLHKTMVMSRTIEDLVWWRDCGCAGLLEFNGTKTTDKQTNTYQQHNWIQLAEFEVRLIQSEV